MIWHVSRKGLLKVLGWQPDRWRHIPGNFPVTSLRSAKRTGRPLSETDAMVGALLAPPCAAATPRGLALGDRELGEHSGGVVAG